MVVVNKGDLVTAKQKTDIIAKINLLNPGANICFEQGGCYRDSQHSHVQGGGQQDGVLDGSV